MNERAIVESLGFWLALAILPGALGVALRPDLAQACGLALVLLGLLATRDRRGDRPPAVVASIFAASAVAGWLTAHAWVELVLRVGLGLGLALPGAHPADPARAVWLSAVAFGPLAEELLYRERMLEALRRVGVPRCVWIPCGLSALLHDSAWVALAVALVGGFLGIAAWRLRSTALCVGYHAGLNASAILGGASPWRGEAWLLAAGLGSLGFAAWSALRSRPIAVAFVLCLAGVASPSAAPALAMRVETALRLESGGAGLPALEIGRVGVATVDASSGGVALEALALSGGLAGVGVVPVTDPAVSVGGLVALALDASTQPGTLGPFQPPASPFTAQLTDATLPVVGEVRLCLVFTGCGLALGVPLGAAESADVGVGVGGILTAYPHSTVMFSLLGAPWTVRTATLRIPTTGGGELAASAVGVAHGPASFTGSTALTGGEVQLVSPVRVLASGSAPPLPAPFARLSVRFLPEPRSLFVLVPTALLLLWLGRRRGP